MIERILQAQHEISRAMLHETAPDWLGLDLTMSQLKSLFLLFEVESMSIGELAATLQLGKPAASILVDGLVRQGLVEREEDATDRRRTLARLTPRAQELVARLWQGGRRQFEGLLTRLDSDALDVLARGLEALANAAVEKSASSPASNEGADLSRDRGADRQFIDSTGQ